MESTNANLLSLPILELVKTGQQQNGLRHRDFQRYRQYCARRLRRIRKSIKFMHGKGKTYVPKKVDADLATEERFLFVPLYNAERAWGYAMHLKEDDNLEQQEYGDEANSRIKFHLNGRLRKAAYWSQQLANICAVKADARTSLEAEAYAAYMEGNYRFHREEHEIAYEKFSTAQRIYTDLSQVAKSLSQKELYKHFVDELAPFLRFCEHRMSLQGKNLADEMSMEWEAATSNGGVSNALLQSKIDQVLLDARKKNVDTLTTVTWKQHDLAIPTEDITLSVLRAKELSTKLEQLGEDALENPELMKSYETLFLELLTAYDSVLQTIKSRREKLEQQAKSGSTLVQSDLDSLDSLQEYIKYLKLTKQVSKMVRLYYQLASAPPDTKRPGDLTHVLDMLLQYVAEILSVYDFKKLEPVLAARYESYGFMFKAIRAATIAVMYAEDQKFPQAMVLYQYAIDFLRSGEDLLVKQPAAKDDILQSGMKAVDEELVGALSRTTAQSFLVRSKKAQEIRLQLAQLKLNNNNEISDQDNKVKKTAPLLKRLNEYESGTSKGHYELLHFPPEFQPMPCKPVFFDMAFQELEMPDIQERMLTDEEKKARENQKDTSKGGLFGWFR